jgi:hypothetical protein
MVGGCRRRLPKRIATPEAGRRPISELRRKKSLKGITSARRLPFPASRIRDTYGTLETYGEAEDGAIEYVSQAAKWLGFRKLAEREGFESA